MEAAVARLERAALLVLEFGEDGGGELAVAVGRGMELEGTCECLCAGVVGVGGGAAHACTLLGLDVPSSDDGHGDGVVLEWVSSAGDASHLRVALGSSACLEWFAACVKRSANVAAALRARGGTAAWSPGRGSAARPTGARDAVLRRAETRRGGFT